jgi:hypothetical protein
VNYKQRTQLFRDAQPMIYHYCVNRGNNAGDPPDIINLAPIGA